MEDELETLRLGVAALEDEILIEDILVLIIGVGDLGSHEIAIVLDLHLAGEFDSHPHQQQGEMILVALPVFVHYKVIAISRISKSYGYGWHYHFLRKRDRMDSPSPPPYLNWVFLKDGLFWLSFSLFAGLK
jgi:hypothetical protein